MDARLRAVVIRVLQSAYHHGHMSFRGGVVHTSSASYRGTPNWCSIIVCYDDGARDTLLLNGEWAPEEEVQRIWKAHDGHVAHAIVNGLRWAIGDSHADLLETANNCSLRCEELRRQMCIIEEMFPNQ